MTYPVLPQSFKACFPFRLSAPSFIYPADYLTNARRLCTFVDEIELLVFESRPESLPSPVEIDQLATLGQRENLSFNVHLPLDLDLSAADGKQRDTVLERLTSVIERVRPLTPTTHTLHLPCREMDRHDRAAIAGWQVRTTENLGQLLKLTGIDPRSLSIETLEYPPDCFASICETLDLSVCVDVGHVLRYGYNLDAVWQRFASRVTIFHLHGVRDGQDHLALDNLPDAPKRLIQKLLAGFGGTVSLEVFSFKKLRASLTCLAEMMLSAGRC